MFALETTENALKDQSKQYNIVTLLTWIWLVAVKSIWDVCTSFWLYLDLNSNVCTKWATIFTRKTTLFYYYYCCQYLHHLIIFVIITTMFLPLCLSVFISCQSIQKFQEILNLDFYLIHRGRLFSFHCPCLKISCLSLI